LEAIQEELAGDGDDGAIDCIDRGAITGG